MAFISVGRRGMVVAYEKWSRPDVRLYITTVYWNRPSLKTLLSEPPPASKITLYNKVWEKQEQNICDENLIS